MPICSHTNSSQQLQIIKGIQDYFESENPNSILLNVATDGDVCRRSLLKSARMDILDKSCDFFLMPLFDTKILLGKYSINFDPKHLTKRLRGMLISENRNIILINKAFNKEHIKILIPNLSSSLLEPKDYQNVPAAVKLMEEIGKIDENPSILNKVSLDIKNEIKLFILIVRKLLVIFTEVSISLYEQLSSLASLSFLIFFIQRRNRTNFLTNDLYTDIQMTIQDSFWATYIFQKHASNFTEDFKLFLYLLGTDQLEAFFGVLRTQTHASNCSLYELYQRINLCLQIEKVYAEHPEWKQGSRLCVGTTHDHSSARSWIGDLNVSEIVLPTIWGRGLKSAKEILNQYGYSHTELEVDLQNNPRHTVINYKGDYFNDFACDDLPNLGINISSVQPENFELSEDYLDNLEGYAENYVLDSTNFATVSHMGLVYNKSNVINSMINCKTKISTDRCFRVRSLNDSKF